MSVRALLRFLARPDVRRRRAVFLSRRVRFELARRAWPRWLRGERVVRIDGGLIRVRLGDVVDRAIYLYGAHEFLALEAFRALVMPGATIVDAGAHIGQYTIAAALRVGPQGRVLAFEPSPATRGRLEANVRLNRLENVSVFGLALGDAPGEAHVLPPADSANTGTAAVIEGPSQGADSVRVRRARLDDVLAETGIRSVDVIKVDVEGAEADVLAGAKAQLVNARPAVLFEVTSFDEVAGSAPSIELLRQLGYDLFGIGAGSELVRIGPEDDPRGFREPWTALNLLALHPSRGEPGT